MVMTTSFGPLLRSRSNLKNSPDEKAMNASAMSGMNSVPSMMFDGMTWRQHGPSATPVRMYAVTFGSFSGLVTRVARKPQNSMIATEMTTTETGDVPFKCEKSSEIMAVFQVGGNNAHADGTARIDAV